jgi:hypothetical protein
VSGVVEDYVNGQLEKAFQDSLYRMDHLHKLYVDRHPDISIHEDGRIVNLIGKKELEMHGSCKEEPAIRQAVDAFKEDRRADWIEIKMEREIYNQPEHGFRVSMGI